MTSENFPLGRRSALALGSAMLASGLLPGMARASGTPRRGGTLVMAGNLSLRHFNGAIQSGVATNIPSSQIFASPLRFDAEWKPQPYLAQSWSVAEDGLSVTLNLVPNAVFHDGKPVTSEDVAFSIDIIQKNHPFKTMLEPVERVDTPDPHTAIIRLRHPHPALLLAMSPGLMPILPKHVYGDGQNIQTHPANLNPVGSGPFKLQEYKAGEHWILERFDRFFIPDRPYLDRIVARVIADPSVYMLGLERNEIHMVTYVTGSRDVIRAERAANLTVTDNGYDGAGSLNWLAFNTERAPFNDVRVRQAIAYAADRDAIIRRVMGGKAKPSYGPIVSSSPFAARDLERYAYNPDRANALLDEAGHPRSADGTRFSMTIDTPSGSPEQNRNVAEFLRVQLRRVGITAQVRVAPDFPTWAQRVSSHDFDMTTDTVYNWGDPVIGVHRTYLSSNIRRGVIWSNTQSYRNPEVDRILNEAGLAQDPARRRELYQDFQRRVVADVPIFFMNESPYHTVANKGLANLPLSIWGALSPMDELYWQTPPA